MLTSYSLQLKQLADTVHAGLAAITRAESSKLAIALDIGDALAKAKVLAGHGNWLAWLEFTSLSARTAEIYIKLAAHREQIANSQHAANLTIRAALRLIGAARTSRRPRPQAALQVSSWRQASVEARRAFVAGILLVEWLEAMPAAWRAEIADRVDGLRAAHTKKPTTVIPSPMGGRSAWSKAMTVAAKSAVITCDTRH